MNKSKVTLLFIIILAAFLHVGCSKNDDSNNNSSSETGYFVPDNDDTLYCLMCHESYDALAAKTATTIDPATGLEEARGDRWGNPHNSFHGGPIPCMSCHSDEWMPLANEGECTDPMNMARLSQTCISCHEPQELYLEKDKHPEWDYTK